MLITFVTLDYLDGKLKHSGFDISTAPKVHIAIRKTLKAYPLPTKPYSSKDSP